jgi:hypothetical protein
VSKPRQLVRPSLWKKNAFWIFFFFSFFFFFQVPLLFCRQIGFVSPGLLLDFLCLSYLVLFVCIFLVSLIGGGHLGR